MCGLTEGGVPSLEQPLRAKRNCLLLEEDTIFYFLQLNNNRRKKKEKRKEKGGGERKKKTKKTSPLPQHPTLSHLWQERSLAVFVDIHFQQKHLRCMASLCALDDHTLVCSQDWLSLSSPQIPFKVSSGLGWFGENTQSSTY